MDTNETTRWQQQTIANSVMAANISAAQSTLDHIEWRLDRIEQTIEKLYTRNEFGFTEDQARAAHGIRRWLLHGRIPSFKPWRRNQGDTQPQRGGLFVDN